jgi:hypothetical protein
MATTTTYGLNKPTVGGDENTWGGLTNDNWDDVDDLLDGTTAITPNLGAGWEVDGVAVTATAAELNILDGVTASAAELNILDGVTATTAELNILDGVTASTAEINTLDGINTASNFGLVPSGAILLWSGSVATVPTGWFLCNGTNGTPDLRNRFIVGAGSAYAVAATGGSADAIVVAHTHTGTTSTTGAHTHTYFTAGTGGGGPAVSAAGESVAANTGSAGNHSHSFTTNSTGSSGTNANLPPYYALAYIMKA